MLPNMPIYVPVTFALTTLLTLILFYIALKKSTTHAPKANLIIGILVLWAIFQTALAASNILSNTPPILFLLGVLPTFITMIVLFNTEKGRAFIDSLPLVNLTYLSIVRIPVEIVLLWLFLNGAVPELMTFEGRNFDILAGITAPFIAYFGYTKGKIGRKGLLAWNIISLGLLLFIVINATLAAELPIQQFAFDQPNIAILHAPFNLLPTLVVPLVLFTHFVSIRRLLKD